MRTLPGCPLRPTTRGDLNPHPPFFARRSRGGRTQSTCIIETLGNPFWELTLTSTLKGHVHGADRRVQMATRLNITYSAYRELETIPRTPLREIGEAIIGLANDPHPPGSSLLQGIGGCYYLAIDDYYILYHLDEDEGLTVLGVLHGPYHPLH
jgi:mRNA interferase RelE/StbE